MPRSAGPVQRTVEESPHRTTSRRVTRAMSTSQQDQGTRDIRRVPVISSSQPSTSRGVEQPVRRSQRSGSRGGGPSERARSKHQRTDQHQMELGSATSDLGEPIRQLRNRPVTSSGRTASRNRSEEAQTNGEGQPRLLAVTRRAAAGQSEDGSEQRRRHPSGRVMERPQEPLLSSVPAAEEYRCPNCGECFATKIGLGQHRRHRHLDVVNEEINIMRVKKQWSDEERRIYAREEAEATVNGVRFINQHLEAKFVGRTLDAIKGLRKQPAYKQLVLQYIQERPANQDEQPPAGSQVPELTQPSVAGGNLRGREESHEAATSSTMLQGPGRWNGGGGIDAEVNNLMEIVRNVRGWESERLLAIAQAALEGRDVSADCFAWIQSVFPTPQPRSNPRRQRTEDTTTSKRKQRRIEYAHTQKMMRKNMSRAAKEILDGKNNSRSPDLPTMTDYWEPIMRQGSAPAPRIPAQQPRKDFNFIWQAITCQETKEVQIPLDSAPGTDGITSRQWRAVPASIKALFFNIILGIGGFPSNMLVSRTIFLPKKDASVTPAEFRPISIASVVVRHLHKILAERALEAGLVDQRQRCLDDGCAENIAALASILYDAERSLRELHIASLDYAKAYDSVSHEAIIAVLEKNGLPPSFVSYVSRLYSNSTTVLEVEGTRSESIKVNRGVRQGDPLSTWIFCLVINEVLQALPREVGYDIEGKKINALAYADDVFLCASTAIGMDKLLQIAEDTAEKMGLSLNASKCVALSIVPAGKQKKYKVVTDPRFGLKDGSLIHQLTPSEEWRYLGVDFRPIGPRRAGGTLEGELNRLTKAPLKPQQRLKILRCFLVNRVYHKLVLAGATLGKLRALDKQVRVAIRRWLKLPKDTPIGYFHAACREGGLGIPSFETTVPGLMLDRFKGLRNSSARAIRAIAQSDWVAKRLVWAERALTKDGECLDTASKRNDYWSAKLHQSVDGKELRECKKSGLSTNWIDAGSYGIPGRDYIQYHHVRVNCLPSRIRTSRGVRRDQMDVTCRAGCNTTETTAHIIQGCFRTHGGRIKRHNAVCRILATGLRDKGWTVSEEPRIQTTVGLRKPDIVATKEDKVCLIDSQVVSGQQQLDEAHNNKVEKYRGNADVVKQLRAWRGGQYTNAKVSSCTISWRGVWASKSAEFLLNLGLSKRLLAGITTRILQGSHTNWTRWNQMTTRKEGQGHRRTPRQGVG